MIFQGVVDQWESLKASGDVRSNALPFVRDPTVVICAAVAYLVMVTVGPRVMEKRAPLEIRKVLILYNFGSVLFSMWMMWEVGAYVIRTNFRVEIFAHHFDLRGNARK